jgi:glutamine amidotransferase
MTPTVRLLDYGVGNIHSLTKALERAGLDVELAPAEDGVGDADGLVLPGVGAFGPAAEALAPVRDEIRDAVDDGLPLLGVCLGMQLFAEGSVEGEGQGLGLIEGQVRPLDHDRLPHIGWNTIEAAEGPAAPLAEGHVYYVHSYVLPDNPHTVAETTYGEPFPAIVAFDHVIGAQFHPEKSSRAGRVVLDAYADLLETQP